jgi:RsiW-degrading membrane proteinase PrsW (M82 family)
MSHMGENATTDTTTTTARRVRSGLPIWARVVAVAGAGVIAWYTLTLLAYTPWGILSLAPLASVPFAVLMLIRWSDRYRVAQEHLFPWALLVGGGLIAMFAFVINAVVSALTGDLTVTVLGAPLSEELLKGAAVVTILRLGAIGPVTMHGGASVGALVGAGFAFTEDLSYALSSQDPLLGTALRLVFAPFFHASTAALFGLAYALRSMSAFGAATAVAIGLHALWNTMAQISESLLLALGFSSLLTGAFIAAWVTFGVTQRRAVSSGVSVPQLLLPIERELLCNPSLIGELAARRTDSIQLDDLLRWKRAVLCVSECDRRNVADEQSRLAELNSVRGGLHSVLTSRCAPECEGRFPGLAHHHFLRTHQIVETDSIGDSTADRTDR